MSNSSQKTISVEHAGALRELCEQLSTHANVTFRADDAELQLWEMRCTSQSAGRVDFDGGLRVERRVEGRREWFYTVGAGPGVPAGAAETSWSSYADILGVSLAATDRELLRRGQRFANECERRLGGRWIARSRVWFRLRAWRRGIDPPGAGFEAGLHLSAIRTDRPQPPVGWHGTRLDAVPGVEDRSFWEAAAAVASFDDRVFGEPPEQHGTGGWRGGLVILLPQAAAWWGHELVHAAIEGASLEPRDELELIESPGRCGHPAGFDIDDEARRADEVSLTQPGVAQRIARRRASIRDEALPAPAVSLLRAPRTAGRWDEPPGPHLVVRSIRAGRFDPLTHELRLVADKAALRDRNGLRALTQPCHLSAPVGKAWSSAVALEGPWTGKPELASCTRLGQRLPVAVGAPTICLELARG